jgi:hypothetical protein
MNVESLRLAFDGQITVFFRRSDSIQVSDNNWENHVEFDKSIPQHWILITHGCYRKLPRKMKFIAR